MGRTYCPEARRVAVGQWYLGVERAGQALRSRWNTWPGAGEAGQPVGVELSGNSHFFASNI